MVFRRLSPQAKPLVIVALFLATLGITCAQVTPPDPPPPITFEDMRLYATWASSDEFVVTFPSSITTEHEENNSVPIHILLPHGKTGPFPVVLILHYWGALNRNVERAMGQELNRRGIAAVLMTLPYHLERTPAGSRSGELTIQPDITKLRGTLLQSLQDTRRAIDFIDSRPEFDHDKIGITGLSLGAIVTALVYGVDTRIHPAAFVLGGVDVADILWHSSRVVPQREALRQKGYTEEKLRDELADLEPGTFLRQRGDKNAFVVSARYDTVIPPRSSKELVDDLGSPKTSYLNTGHFGGAFVQNKLLKETGDFFQAAFNNQEFTPPSNLGAPTIRLGVQYNVSQGMDIGFGADLFSFGHEREYAGTALVTPRGVRLFIGRRVGEQLSAGIFLGPSNIGVGVLWSTVL